MKNIKEYQLKKCIFMGADDFDAIIKKLFGETTEVEFKLEGIWIGGPNDDCCETLFEDIGKKLAEYFDVKDVTSIHMDYCNKIGVWICYKEN